MLGIRTYRYCELIGENGLLDILSSINLSMMVEKTIWNKKMATALSWSKEGRPTLKHPMPNRISTGVSSFIVSRAFLWRASLRLSKVKTKHNKIDRKATTCLT